MSPAETAGVQATPQAERVRRFLEDHGLAKAIVHCEESTKTAQAAADAMGCDLGQIAKSLVFVADETPVLAIIAGDRRGDAAAIARAAGAAQARLAEAATVAEITGYAVGAVSPFDLPPELTVLVDESLARYAVVFPAAGTDSSMVGLTLEQLVRITGGRTCPIGSERGR